MKNTFVISAPIDTYSGYGHNARSIVKKIIESNKYDVKVIPQRWGNTPWGFLDDHKEWSFMKEYLHQGQLPEQPDIWMQITVPNEFHPIGKYNIGVTAAIETTQVAPQWIEGCNRMNLILTSSEHSKSTLVSPLYDRVDKNTQQKVGVLKLTTPVEVIGESVDIELYKQIPSKKSTLDLSYIKENWCYLFVGHWMQGEFGEDRKNVGLLIKAFYETFKNKKDAPALILKTSQAGASYMDRREVMRKIDILRKATKAHTLPSVYLLHGELSDNEMNELYNHSKVKAMVCLTKGEGFGRPLLEFSLVNKPIITTKWSGHLDFLNPEFTSLINGEVRQIHPSAVIKDMLIPESGWFSPNPNEVSFYLKDVHKKYKQYKEKAKRQGFQSRSNFSHEKRKEILLDILDKNIPEIAKKVELKLPSLTANAPNMNLPKLDLPKLNKI